MKCGRKKSESNLDGKVWYFAHVRPPQWNIEGRAGQAGYTAKLRNLFSWASGIDADLIIR